MPRIERNKIIEKFQDMVRRRVPIVGGGAGTGLSAKCEEAGGIDLIVIYNSGRYRMAGRGSAAGLLAYGNANEIVKEMAAEVLPVVKTTPVLAGVNGTDPFVLMPQFLAELRDMGFSGVQNFPTIGLFDGVMRSSFEGTGMSYALEVDMIALAHKLDLLTTPYVFNPDEAVAMTKAGADIIVAHMGVTVGGAIGATSAKSLETSAGEIDRIAAAALRRAQGCDRALPRRTDRDAERRGIHPAELPELPRLLRRVVDGAAAGRDGADSAGQIVQDDRDAGRLNVGGEARNWRRTGDARKVRDRQADEAGGARLGEARLDEQPALDRRGAVDGHRCHAVARQGARLPQASRPGRGDLRASPARSSNGSTATSACSARATVHSSPPARCMRRSTRGRRMRRSSPSSRLASARSATSWSTWRKRRRGRICGKAKVREAASFTVVIAGCPDQVRA